MTRTATRILVYSQKSELDHYKVREGYREDEELAFLVLCEGLAQTLSA